ncbi:MAG: SprT-like domain-containing protein [Candidatus Zixiibacteriota bacterium]
MSRARRMRAPAGVNYDLFESRDSAGRAPGAAVGEGCGVDPGGLPSVAELSRLFDDYNSRHFDGELPKAEITYSTRMLAAGICYPLEKRIKIGVRYHQLFPHETAGTLLHEMLHLVYPTHCRIFRARARQIGAPLNARYHAALRRPARYLYRCPGCACEFPRQRRLRETSCGSCSVGGYDSRFKLKLVDSPALRARGSR